MARATLTISSDTKDGAKAIEMLTKELGKLKEENKQLAEANRKAAAERKEQQKAESDANRKLIKDTKDREKAEREAAREEMRIAREKDAAWTKFGGTIMTAVGSYVSLNTVLSQANMLLERQSQLQQEIHARSMSLGQAQANTAINFAGLSEADRKTAIGIGGRVNLAQGFGNRPALESAAGSLISAGATPQQAEKTLSYAANIAPGNSELVESLSSGIVDLQGSTGMSMEEASGLLLSSAANARAKNPAQVSKSLSKVTSNASSLFDKGGTALAGEEAAALWATITKLRGDVSGDESATLANNAMTKLATFEGFGADGPSTIMGRIQALQSDQALAQRFLEHGNYLKQDPAIGRLLTDRDFGYARMLDEVDKNVGYDPSLEGAIKQLHDSQPNIGMVKAQNRITSLREAGAQANLVEARIQIAEDARIAAHETLDPLSANYTYMGKMSAPGRGSIDLFGSEEERISKRLKDIQALQTTFGTTPHDITEERRSEIAGILQQLVETTKEQLEITRQSQQSLSNISEKTMAPTIQKSGGIQEAQ